AASAVAELQRGRNLDRLGSTAKPELLLDEVHEPRTRTRETPVDLDIDGRGDRLSVVLIEEAKEFLRLFLPVNLDREVVGVSPLERRLHVEHRERDPVD